MATWMKLAAGLSLFWAASAQAADRTPEQVVKVVRGVYGD